MKRVGLWLTHFNKAEMKVHHVFLLRNTETWRRPIESPSTIFFHYNITQSFENRFSIPLKVFRYYIILSYLCLSYLKADFWKPPSNVQFQGFIHKIKHASPWRISTSQSYQSLGNFYKPRDTFSGDQHKAEWWMPRNYCIDINQQQHQQ